MPNCPQCHTKRRVESYRGPKQGNYKCQHCKYVWTHEDKKFPAPKPEDRICYHCRLLWITNYQPGYSEYTPSSPFHFSCGKGHWDFDTYEDSNYEFAYCLSMAKDCEDFSLNDLFIESDDG